MALTKIDDRGLKTPIDLLDNEKIRLGTGNDLQIYHDGNHSRIDDTGTGSLVLRSSNFLVEKYGGDYMINGVADGAVELYHDGSKKFETYSNGCTVTGNLNAGNVDLADNAKARFGGSNDLQIYHNGTNSIISNDTGDLILGAGNGSSVKLQPEGGEDGLTVNQNGAVELYYDNSKKFETRSGGVGVFGHIEAGDDNKLMLGDSNDLQIFHDASDSFIKVPSGGVGNITVDLTNGAAGFFVRTNSSTMANQTLKNNSSGADSKDFFQCRSNNNTLKLHIEGDGDVKNANNSYGAISDIKLKENIVNAGSQWDDIKGIKVRNFNFKDDSTKTKMLGVVAQEIETVSAGLVDQQIDRDNTGKNLGTTTKSVKYSILYMKAIKCLQEAITKIETLETKVAALEAA
tara:strand:- start:315 stop:1520 length:1206 start_codon:yes stop_codon:yes gene_type:complete